MTASTPSLRVGDRVRVRTSSSAYEETHGLEGRITKITDEMGVVQVEVLSSIWKGWFSAESLELLPLTCAKCGATGVDMSPDPARNNEMRCDSYKACCERAGLLASEKVLPEYPCCEAVKRIEAVQGDAATLLGGMCLVHGPSLRASRTRHANSVPRIPREEGTRVNIHPSTSEDPPDELAPLAARIAKGRAKYANGCTVLSLIDETGEVAHSVNKYEGEDRIKDELLDVAAVAMRLYFGEIDRGLQIDGLVQQRTDMMGQRSSEASPDAGHPHLINGEFQSDKYPTCPRGKVPLSTKDPTAQDLLWEYAQRRRAVDAEFATDLETVLRSKGFTPRVQDAWRPTGGARVMTPSGVGHIEICGDAQSRVRLESGGSYLFWHRDIKQDTPRTSEALPVVAGKVLSKLKAIIDSGGVTGYVASGTISPKLIDAFANAIANADPPRTSDESGDPPEGSRLWRCEKELAKAREECATWKRAAKFDGKVVTEDALPPELRRTDKAVLR